jgi:hypothetical protein
MDIENEEYPDQEDNPLQGYFDWQVTTLLLAYDLMQPLADEAPKAIEQRRTETEQEVRDFTLAVVPKEYLDDPSLDWPCEVMMAITRATFDRLNQITAG